MKAEQRFAARVGAFLWVLALPASGQDSEPEKEEPKPPSPLATLDIRNTGSGSIPGGSSVQAGKWQVFGEDRDLQVMPKPLVISWLEFGPEVREKGTTILATGRSSGSERLQSRFGAGLYGKNGFQLRLVPLKDEVELVRRQEVLRSVPMVLETDREYTIELTVKGEEDQWVIQGRVWETEEKAETGTSIEYRIYDEELLFPLVGRAVLTGTPYSGEPVSFSRAEIYPDGYIREEAPDDAEESASDESEEESD